jgi:GT2 family glycosyltransferase
MSSAREPAVGVVIATRDRVDSLLRTLEHLRRLPERPPIVVVDNASRDRTIDAVHERFGEVRVIALRRNLGAAARTLGSRALKTPFVAFSDDDSWWAPGALARAAAAFEQRPRLALVAARILVGEGQREDETCVAMGRSPLPLRPGMPGRPVLGFVACGAVVRRAAYLEVGGFHPRLLYAGEERMLAVDLAAAGWELSYVPDVLAYHHPSPQRDHGGRRRLEARNDLWTAWLRRPRASAARQTLGLVRAAAGDRQRLAGVVDACAGLPWVVRERRPVNGSVEAQLRMLEAPERVYPARR